MHNSINIFKFLMVFISQVTLFYALDKLSEKRIKFSISFLIIMIFSSFIEEIISHIITVPINGAISLIYFVIVSKIFTKMSLKEIVFNIISIWLIAVLIDISLMLLLNIFQNCKQIDLNMNYVKPICTIIMSILLILIFRIKKIIKLLKKIQTKFEKINPSFFLLIIMLFLYLLLDAIGIMHLNSEVTISIVLLSSILLTLTIIKFVLNNYDILILKETNELLMKNNEFYLKLLEDYRILKHNLTSQLLGIKSVSNQKAKLLIDDLIKTYNDSFKTTNEIKDIPSGLNGIIYEKLYHFNHKELKISVDNKIKNKIFDILSAHSYNILCEAIGVALDNAMEAATESKDKIIYLKFKESKEFIKVNIMNTFSGTMDLDKLGTMNYTSKKKGHGLGLYSLIHRNRLHISTRIKNNLFVHEFLIEKNKN